MYISHVLVVRAPRPRSVQVLMSLIALLIDRSSAADQVSYLGLCRRSAATQQDILHEKMPESATSSSEKPPTGGGILVSGS